MLDKFLHEWKTVAWGVAGGALELWDQVLCNQMDVVAPMVPEQHQWMLHVALPVGFFALRRWTDRSDD